MNQKTLLLLAIAIQGSGTITAQNADSLRIEQIQEVVVQGVKASKSAPFAVTNLNRQQLSAFSTTGQELPFLFAQTPGVVGWSENGTGIGTSHLRIRGAADSRINVTLDGVQLNSPEDQTVFWANMNSYSALLGSAQIQRGVGTSTNGDGAFGGNVVLSTKSPNQSPALELSASAGTYSTYNVGGSFSTGLLWKKLVFDGTYHHTTTDGFMHGTQGKSGSYYGGLQWIDRNFVVRYRNIGNYENTGQAWNGLDTGDLLDGNYGVSTGLHNYKDFWNAGLGKYNSLYEYMNNPSDPAQGTSRYRLNDGTLWNKTTDNFWQNHNILSLSAELKRGWKTALTLRYSYGYGYYEEFRYNNKLSKFGLSNFTLSDGTTLKRTDFVRKKGLDQNTYGVNWNASYNESNREVIFGLSGQHFTSNHFGHLTYVANQELANSLLTNGKYTYYDSDATKDDINVFVKGTYKFHTNWSTFADLQYRYVRYTTDGYNDKFIDNGDGTYSKHWLDINKRYNFFNPKVGINFTHGKHRAFASMAVAHREPERNNFTDNGNYPAPEAEQLTDYEVGYQYDAARWNIGLTGYYMKYDNQFVQTGEKTDIGENRTTNIKDSYRMGLELTAAWQPLRWLDLSGNVALSTNKLKNFDEHVEDWDTGGEQVIHYDNSTLAFSPSTILNGFLSVHKYGVRLTWHTNFVSRQYLDNTSSRQRSLPSYSQSNLALSYTLSLSRIGLKEIVVGANINNVFDAHYAAGGWVYSAIYASGGHTNDNRYRQIGYMPMAGRTLMVNLKIKI